MSRQPIYFDKDVLDRLKQHTKEKYGNRRAISLVVQLAVKKYLDTEENKSGKKRPATRPETI